MLLNIRIVLKCIAVRCPNDCSGHGQCLTIREMAQISHALPLDDGSNAEYGFDRSGAAWDGNSMTGCVCDSSWPVGIADGQTQLPEYFGADCSLSTAIAIFALCHTSSRALSVRQQPSHRWRRNRLPRTEPDGGNRSGQKRQFVSRGLLGTRNMRLFDRKVQLLRGSCGRQLRRFRVSEYSSIALERQNKQQVVLASFGKLSNNMYKFIVADNFSCADSSCLVLLF